MKLSDFSITACYSIAIALLALVPFTPLQASTEPPESLEELARSPMVVRATLMRTETFRPEVNPRMIRSRHIFRLDRAYRGSASREFKIELAGGRIGNEAVHVSHQPRLDAGQSYLLFLNRFLQTGNLFVEFSEFGAIPLEADAQYSLYSRNTGHIQISEDQFTDLLTSTEKDVRPAVALSGHSSMPRLPISLDPEPTRSSRAPATIPEEEAPYIPVDHSDRRKQGEPDSSDANASDVGINYSYSGRPANGVTMELLPSDWVWSPQDEQMMGVWNGYGGAVFHAVPNVSGWGFPNNASEMAGWPSSEDLVSIGLDAWAPNTIARTHFSTLNGIIVESDVMFNPAKDWTLDEELATSGLPIYNFRWETLHELGHAWGLRHPWEHQDVWWPSVMNYPPRQFKNTRLHIDDVAAVRSAYQSVATTDLSIDLYHTEDLAGDSAGYVEVYPITSSVRHGENVFWNGTHMFIQNLGTTSVSSVPVTYWLHPERWSLADPHFVHQDLALQSGLDPFPDGLGAYYPEFFEIDESVPPGEYFIRIQVGNPDDDHLFNQSAFVTRQGSIQVRNQPVQLFPTQIQQWTSSRMISSGGAWEFTVALEQGATYEFETCGLSSFDTMIELVVNDQTMAFNDDHCGLQSRIEFTWQNPDVSDATLFVRGYSQSSGDFQLGYRKLVAGQLFWDGFEGP